MLTPDEIEKAKNQAVYDLKLEEYRDAVNAEKLRIKNKRSFWDRIWPWKIMIVRKGGT